MNDKNDQSENIIRSFVSLLTLEKTARHAVDQDELQFVIANETRRIIDYDQAIFFAITATGKCRVRAVSGVSHPDTSSPFFQHLHRLIDGLLPEKEIEKIANLKKEDISQNLLPDWNETALQNPIWCPLSNGRGSIKGGLLLTRKAEWQQPELARLEFLIDAYSHAWISLEKKNISWTNHLKGIVNKLHQKKIKVISALAAIVLLMLPVKQSVIAPAEVVPANPFIVSPPFDGIVKEFYVNPNEEVTEGQPLFSLEDRVIRNNFLVAKKALAVAGADYKRTQQKAFSDPDSKSKVPLLKAVVDEKKAVVDYTSELLKQITVRAPRDGIAIYSNPNDWLGKPVSVGEKIITLSDPSDTELLIWLPVNNAINMETGARVRAFLNIDPTSSLEATLRQSSFEAQVSPEDVLAFQLRAAFTAGTKKIHIGLKATAKLYGDKVTLFYYIFRRPMAAVRQFVG